MCLSKLPTSSNAFLHFKTREKVHFTMPNYVNKHFLFKLLNPKHDIVINKHFYVQTFNTQQSHPILSSYHGSN